MADLDLLQGTLDTLVLKTLSWGPRRGYAVARWIKDTTDGSINVEDRALYVALHRLEQRGWIEAQWGLSENNRASLVVRHGAWMAAAGVAIGLVAPALLGRFVSGMLYGISPPTIPSATSLLHFS